MSSTMQNCRRSIGPAQKRSSDDILKSSTKANVQQNFAMKFNRLTREPANPDNKRRISNGVENMSTTKKRTNCSRTIVANRRVYPTESSPNLPVFILPKFRQLSPEQNRNVFSGRRKTGPAMLEPVELNQLGK